MFKGEHHKGSNSDVFSQDPCPRLGIACAQPAPAQTFKRAKVQGGAALVQVSSGGASVWALASDGNPYIFKNKQFVLANTISLTHIAVGGGNTFQADAV
jgi:hypothetical protein